MAKPVRVSYTISVGFNERYPAWVLKQFPNLNPIHKGIDIVCPRGTEVFAVAGGNVVLADNINDANGLRAIIDHGRGERTIYLHLLDITVNIGQPVNTGDLIGHVDSTGYAIGDHLHFERQINGVPADPNIYLGRDTDVGPMPPTPKFAYGTLVTSRVNNLNTRQGSGLIYPITGKMHIGSKGIVKAGPRKVGDYNWYDLDFTQFGGGTGWVAGEFLKIYEPPIVPVIVPEPPKLVEQPDKPITEDPTKPVEAIKEVEDTFTTPNPTDKEVITITEKNIVNEENKQKVGELAKKVAFWASKVAVVATAVAFVAEKVSEVAFGTTPVTDALTAVLKFFNLL